MSYFNGQRIEDELGTHNKNKKTDINIGDMMDDLADYLGVNSRQLERSLQLLVDGKLHEER